MLFAGTIHENIRMGRGDATDAEVEGAACVTSTYDFIAEQPDGYDTIVGEHGSTLSGGRRRQVAIARTLLRRLPTVVFNEAATSLDPEAMSLVLDTTDRLVAGHTILVVTHDAEVVLRAM